MLTKIEMKKNVKYIFHIVLVIFLSGFLSNPLRAIEIKGSGGAKIHGKVVSTFDQPWAISFINSETMLVTTKGGILWLVDSTGSKKIVGNLPTVSVGGQGGLGDVIIHPDFALNNFIYLSFVSSNNFGFSKFAKVIRAKLNINDEPILTDITDIWEQRPATTGNGHFSHRLVFGPAGSDYELDLFISSGDRQKLNPAQSWDSDLGKIIRLKQDGRIPENNPFQNHGNRAKSFWTMGHRNALGLAFDSKGQLWSTEMGPKDGDEFNLIKKGQNYGWPVVSEGSHYSGVAIPPHETRPEFQAPAIFWIPTIAPSGLDFYEGEEFPSWQGDALIGGLRSRALIRVSFIDNKAKETERFSWSKRVRDVEVCSNGFIWVIEDGKEARLIKFSNSAES